MKMLPFKKLFSAIAIASTLMVAPVAHAGALVNNLFSAGTNQVEDTNVDRILRASVGGGIFLGSTEYRQLTGTDTIAENDIFQSVLNFTNVNGTPIAANGGVFNAPYGLLAYSELVVGAITTSGGLDSFNFKANTTSGLLSGGALVNLYEHTVGSLATLFSGTPAAAIATVTGSPLAATFGLNGTDDFWQVRLPSGVLAPLFTAPVGSGQAGLYEFGLSVLSNPLALPIATNGIGSFAPGHSGDLHDVVGDGSVFGRSPGTNAAWNASTNTTVAFNTPVPEPELLILLSVGLLAGGLVRRRNV